MGCVCSLSFVSMVISASGTFCCVRGLVFHLGGGGGVCAFYFISIVFGGSVTGLPNLFSNCHLALCW